MKVLLRFPFSPWHEVLCQFKVPNSRPLCTGKE
ncbi:unnamed protein product [Spirodela intermedia]|uniref:Uncharacterized protein n=1 Tax=Spirodela intermedia TaxID=51605 RepID=A0A7I8L211_SPIIN|nr:unnamed protein product [Spirodela intermedia]